MYTSLREAVLYGIFNGIAFAIICAPLALLLFGVHEDLVLVVLVVAFSLRWASDVWAYHQAKYKSSRAHRIATLLIDPGTGIVAAAALIFVVLTSLWSLIGVTVGLDSVWLFAGMMIAWITSLLFGIWYSTGRIAVIGDSRRALVLLTVAVVVLVYGSLRFVLDGDVTWMWAAGQLLLLAVLLIAAIRDLRRR